MPRRPTKVHEERDLLEIGDLRVPIRIITEMGRNNCRASVTTKALIIRLPHNLSRGERVKQLRDMMAWARRTVKEKPAAFSQFRRLESARQYTFSIRGDTYRIELNEHAKRSHDIRKTGELQLGIWLNPEDPRVAGGKMTRQLLAKFFGGIYLLEVDERVRALNAAHFQRPIRRVKMSDTYSRWGSCSHTGNINLATRLLLAPPEVLDAVIIHELAHLVEQNHSARFWAEVERALPNYREYDEWLRKHGKRLRFDPTPA